MVYLVKKFILKSDFITLGQFLKATDKIGSGGEAKFFLFNHKCLVNGIHTQERGKKIRDKDVVMIDQDAYVIAYDS
ncbi:MAG: RNA-binding S4 domain-containing protein [Acholeplasmataceae bacterium]|nr:RNA-binding S4 domain-containing protein [Acholeplasmataceae bacterium]